MSVALTLKLGGDGQFLAVSRVLYNLRAHQILPELYHRANPRLCFRSTVLFVVEIERFVCDRATPPIIEKLQSKGVAMHAYGVSTY